MPLFPHLQKSMYSHDAAHISLTNAALDKSRSYLFGVQRMAVKAIFIANFQPYKECGVSSNPV